MASWWNRSWLALRLVGAVVVAGLLSLVACHRSAPLPAPPAPGVSLAVLVVFDQLRGDYLERWQDLFEDDGFRRLQKDGAWFTDCHYPYAQTVTGAGHASMLTGCSPDKHGIVGNEWYDRAAGSSVYCVGSDRHERVPPPSAADEKKKSRGGASPQRLLVPTVGDVLKEATGGKSRIVSLSFKDRSAMLPAGQRADACYWLDTGSGTFVTSSYYGSRLHPWVADFNREQPADRWFGRDWDRLRPNLDYVALNGPDDVAGEGKGTGQGRTFPHPLDGGLKQLGSSYYQALYNSPFGNELLLDLVKRAIDAEQLGSRDVPDLLCISFSSNDPVGHCWGPDSQEVLDVTLRSDLIVRDLLAHLDAQVGRGRYLLALTADHGVCPLPEVSRSKGKEAERIAAELLAVKAGAFLAATFGDGGGLPRWLEGVSPPWIYLNRQLLERQGRQVAEVEETLAGWLRRQPGILTAYTRTQLMQGLPAEDVIGERVRRSFHPERCGDVTAVLKPYHLLSSVFATGTNHGTPHPYDTHVPLLVYGPGIPGGPRPEPVTPQAIAAIFAHFLGIQSPAAAEVPVPESLLRP